MAGAKFIPLLVSSDLAVGENRFLVSLVNDENKLMAAPDLPVRMRFYDLAADPATPVTEAPGRFAWTVERERGLYVAPVRFARAGDWGVELVVSRAGAAPEAVRAQFEVKAQSSTPAIGAPAPPSETPKAADAASIRRVSTDPDPDPAFYRRSVKEALAAGEPFVLAFSTPAFCQSRTCGPALDVVKDVADGFKGRVGFIHVEPYRLRFEGQQLQPELDAQGQLQVVPAVTEWGLTTEPYVFVVAADGTVSAKFEGVVGRDELAQAVEKVAG